MLPFLPSHSPEAAAAELGVLDATIGHQGALIDVFDFDAGDPAWDRLWAAAAATGLPLSFHIKAGSSHRLSYQIGSWKSAAFASLLPLQLDEMLAIALFFSAHSGTPSRVHARSCRVGLELAPLLPHPHVDMEWENLRASLDYAPTVPPSELFVVRSSPPSKKKLADQFIPHLGADSCMWASDYPHTDSTFPGDARKAIEEMLRHPADRRPPEDHRAELPGALRVRRCPLTPPAPAVSGASTVALPLKEATTMIAFYRALGLDVTETPYLVRVQFGTQMVNFHRPELWRTDFELRAPARHPAVRRPVLHLGGGRPTNSRHCSSGTPRRSSRGSGRA